MLISRMSHPSADASAAAWPATCPIAMHAPCTRRPDAADADMEKDDDGESGDGDEEDKADDSEDEPAEDEPKKLTTAQKQVLRDEYVGMFKTLRVL